MKYAIIIIAIIILVRWETIVRLVNKTESLVTREDSKAVNQPANMQNEIVPMTTDKNLDSSVDKRIVNLMEEFNRFPSESAKELIIADIKATPEIVGQTAHEGFLSAMMKLTGHVQDKNQLTNDLLFELWPLVKGPHVLLVRQLLAINFNDNMVPFLDQLSKSGRDPSCSIGEMVPDSLEKDEKETFLLGRKEILSKIIDDEAQPPKVRTMGLNCFRSVEIALLKLNPPPAAETPAQGP